jgi:quercetin dioxygenase-like cupin family protein
MKILANGERGCRPGPANWFTGSVWIDSVLDAGVMAGDSKAQAALVTFSPGARTHWHTHPRGQTLYVLTGLGWVQKEGEPAQAIRPGDVVVIQAGENHWHGAEAAHTMVHLAMQESDEMGSPVVWGDPVTDAEYAANLSGFS